MDCGSGTTERREGDGSDLIEDSPGKSVPQSSDTHSPCDVPDHNTPVEVAPDATVAVEYPSLTEGSSASWGASFVNEGMDAPPFGCFPDERGRVFWGDGDVVGMGFDPVYSPW